MEDRLLLSALNDNNLIQGTDREVGTFFFVIPITLPHCTGQMQIAKVFNLKTTYAFTVLTIALHRVPFCRQPGIVRCKQKGFLT